MASAHVFFYRCDVHFAVLFVLLVSVGGEGGGRKDGDILVGLCSTLPSSDNLKFFLTIDTSNMKTISIHVILAVKLKRGSLSLLLVFARVAEQFRIR